MDGEIQKAPQILFVCVENAGRSLMAEAFMKKYAPHLKVASAGTRPAAHPNPAVVAAMQEIGVDITKQPESMTNTMIRNSNHIVNMGCIDQESCPAMFVKDVDDWSIPDPKDKNLEDIRQIRDQIQARVQELVVKLS